MTMHHFDHPQPERLSALAGGDPDATTDAALIAHVGECPACAGLVDELASLRGALAELPDLHPHRPLQLVPPVAEPAAGRRSALDWLRRLAGPALAAGAGLVVIGSVGLGGQLLGSQASGGAAAPATGGSEERQLQPQPSTAAGPRESDEGTSVADGEAPRSPAAPEAMSGQPAPEALSGQPTPEAMSGQPAPQPGVSGWLLVAGAGALLLLAGVIGRYAINPRAG